MLLLGPGPAPNANGAKAPLPLPAVPKAGVLPKGLAAAGAAALAGLGCAAEAPNAGAVKPAPKG